MSYEASAHEAQMKIMRHLLFVPSAKFADLQKKTGLTSDHAAFHINKLINVGYVIKASDVYSLSPKGKEYANRLDTDENVIEKQPKLSVVLVIEREDGALLQQERLKQPFYGFWGFPTGKIRWGETILEAAARELVEETGLTAELRESGVFHKMDFDTESGNILEDKYFCIIHGINPTGDLIEDVEGHHNEWQVVTGPSSERKEFESIVEIAQLARKPDFELHEQRYEYSTEEY